MPSPGAVLLPFALFAVTAAGLGLVALGVSPPCAGDEAALSTLVLRAKDRGVILPFATAVLTALTGVPVAFAFGVPGADLTVGVGRVPANAVEGVALGATRGVRGVRVVRFDASVGFNGRLVLLRSVDIGEVGQPLQARLSSCAQTTSSPGGW